MAAKPCRPAPPAGLAGCGRPHTRGSLLPRPRGSPCRRCGHASAGLCCGPVLLPLPPHLWRPGPVSRSVSSADGELGTIGIVLRCIVCECLALKKNLRLCTGTAGQGMAHHALLRRPCTHLLLAPAQQTLPAAAPPTPPPPAEYSRRWAGCPWASALATAQPLGRSSAWPCTQTPACRTLLTATSKTAGCSSEASPPPSQCWVENALALCHGMRIRRWRRTAAAAWQKLGRVAARCVWPACVPPHPANRCRHCCHAACGSGTQQPGCSLGRRACPTTQTLPA